MRPGRGVVILCGLGRLSLWWLRPALHDSRVYLRLGRLLARLVRRPVLKLFGRRVGGAVFRGANRGAILRPWRGFGYNG